MENSAELNVVISSDFCYFVTMSKQNKDKLNSSVTLFNYFSRSPATPKLKTSSNPGTPVAASNGNGTPKSIKKEPAEEKKHVANDENEEEIAPMKKRRRIVIEESSDDSDAENKIKNDKTPPKVVELTSFERVEKDETNSPLQKKIKLEERSCPEPKELLEDDEQATSSALDEPTIWAHQKLDFLQPNKIKDIQGNKPGSEKYDARTLYVPESFLNSVTPVSCLRIRTKEDDLIDNFRPCVNGGK